MRLTEGRATGLPKIYRALKQNGSPKPIFETDDNLTYLLVTILTHKNDQVSDQVNDQESNQEKALTMNALAQLLDNYDVVKGNQVSNQVSVQVKSSINIEFGSKAISVLRYINGVPKSSVDILQHLKLSNHTANKNKYIDPLFNIGWIKYTIPENPKNRNQKYTLTETGCKVLKLLQ
jgi:ATP-dependent DNA helicase RecG